MAALGARTDPLAPAAEADGIAAIALNPRRRARHSLQALGRMTPDLFSDEPSSPLAPHDTTSDSVHSHPDSKPPSPDLLLRPSNTKDDLASSSSASLPARPTFLAPSPTPSHASLASTSSDAAHTDSTTATAATATDPMTLDQRRSARARLSAALAVAKPPGLRARRMSSPFAGGSGPSGPSGDTEWSPHPSPAPSSSAVTVLAPDSPVQPMPEAFGWGSSTGASPNPSAPATPVLGRGDSAAGRLLAVSSPATPTHTRARRASSPISPASSVEGEAGAVARRVDQRERLGAIARASGWDLKLQELVMKEAATEIDPAEEERRRKEEAFLLEVERKRRSFHMGYDVEIPAGLVRARSLSFGQKASAGSFDGNGGEETRLAAGPKSDLNSPFVVPNAAMESMRPPLPPSPAHTHSHPETTSSTSGSGETPVKSAASAASENTPPGSDTLRRRLSKYRPYVNHGHGQANIGYRGATIGGGSTAVMTATRGAAAGASFGSIAWGGRWVGRAGAWPPSRRASVVDGAGATRAFSPSPDPGTGDPFDRTRSPPPPRPATAPPPEETGEFPSNPATPTGTARVPSSPARHATPLIVGAFDERLREIVLEAARARLAAAGRSGGPASPSSPVPAVSVGASEEGVEGAEGERVPRMAGVVRTLWKRHQEKTGEPEGDGNGQKADHPDGDGTAADEPAPAYGAPRQASPSPGRAPPEQSEGREKTEATQATPTGTLHRKRSMRRKRTTSVPVDWNWGWETNSTMSGAMSAAEATDGGTEDMPFAHAARETEAEAAAAAMNLLDVNSFLVCESTPTAAVPTFAFDRVEPTISEESSGAAADASGSQAAASTSASDLTEDAVTALTGPSDSDRRSVSTLDDVEADASFSSESFASLSGSSFSFPAVPSAGLGIAGASVQEQKVPAPAEPPSYAWGPGTRTPRRRFSTSSSELSSPVASPASLARSSPPASPMSPATASTPYGSRKAALLRKPSKQQAAPVSPVQARSVSPAATPRSRHALAQQPHPGVLVDPASPGPAAVEPVAPREEFLIPTPPPTSPVMSATRSPRAVRAVKLSPAMSKSSEQLSGAPRAPSPPAGRTSPRPPTAPSPLASGLGDSRSVGRKRSTTAPPVTPSPSPPLGDSASSVAEAEKAGVGLSRSNAIYGRKGKRLSRGSTSGGMAGRHPPSPDEEPTRASTRDEVMKVLDGLVGAVEEEMGTRRPVRRATTGGGRERRFETAVQVNGREVCGDGMGGGVLGA
ncbi:hypothetical protein HDU96_007106 [Phlyctochytrium bullatum]|nr:hypothetical protein HDU96_007106 [Phlyctochytrium bullatum]